MEEYHRAAAQLRDQLGRIAMAQERMVELMETQLEMNREVQEDRKRMLRATEAQDAMIEHILRNGGEYDG